MGNGLKFLLGASALGVIYTFLNKKKAALENIQIRKIDVYIDQKKTTDNFYLKLFYTLKMNLYNYANVNVVIKSIDAKFYLNGIEFGNLTSTLNATIKPKNEKRIELNASIATGNIIASIMDIISEGSAKIEVRGTLLTDLGLIEFKENTIV